MLSEEQQRLLHAWVDGECTAAEAEIAVDLLSRPEASEYVSELKRLRELVAMHAGIHAPAGLLERVREAMRRDSRRRSVFQIFTWRGAGLAAAAVVVVAVGIVLSPMLNKPEPEPQIAEQPAMAHEVEHTDNARAVVEDANHAIADIVEGKVADLVRDVDAGPELSPPAIEPTVAGGRRARNVLRLDRGFAQPLEISVQMNRENSARNLQVYNDLLMVSCLYGKAELKDGAVIETFPGRDFSEYDGVSIEVEADRVPELIGALNRLAAEQAYGQVVIPYDLRESIASSAGEVERLQRVGVEAKHTQEEEARRAWGARHYLPPEVQREWLESELKDSPDALKRLNAVVLKEASKVGPASETTRGPASPKVRLLVRLR